MEVTCRKCGTEYEFDDALLSTRGTAVRCTQCSHQFRVFPKGFEPSDPSARPRRGAGSGWAVHTATGKTYHFRSLGELQAEIRDGNLALDDRLARPGVPAKRLGDIAELRAFFKSDATSTKPKRTVAGVGPKRTQAMGGQMRVGGRDDSQAPTREAMVPSQMADLSSKGRTAELQHGRRLQGETPVLGQPVGESAQRREPTARFPTGPGPQSGETALPEVAEETQAVTRQVTATSAGGHAAAPQSGRAAHRGMIRSAKATQMGIGQGAVLAGAAPTREAVGGQSVAAGARPAARPGLRRAKATIQGVAPTSAQPEEDASGVKPRSEAQVNEAQVNEAQGRPIRPTRQHESLPPMSGHVPLSTQDERPSNPNHATGQRLGRISGTPPRPLFLDDEDQAPHRDRKRSSRGWLMALVASGLLVGSVFGQDHILPRIDALLGRAEPSDNVPAAVHARTEAVQAAEVKEHALTDGSPTTAEQAVAGPVEAADQANADQANAAPPTPAAEAAAMPAEATPTPEVTATDERVAEAKARKSDSSATPEETAKAAAATSDATSEARPKSRTRKPRTDALSRARARQRAAARATEIGLPAGESPSAWLARGDRALDRGQIAIARQAYIRAMELQPSTTARVGLGFCALESGNPSEAVRYFRPAAAAGVGDAFIGLGEAYRRLGQPANAIMAYEAYLGRFPTGAKASIARRQLGALR